MQKTPSETKNSLISGFLVSEGVESPSALPMFGFAERVYFMRCSSEVIFFALSLTSGIKELFK